MSKRMIFHIPMQLDPKMQSGSQICQVKMIQAFKDINYQVSFVFLRHNSSFHTQEPEKYQDIYKIVLQL